MEIEEQLLELYSDNELVIKPALLEQRGGYKYSLAAVSLIDSIANDKKDVHVVNIKNNGTLKFMDDDDIVEIAAVIGADGAKPVEIEEFNNRHIISLMRTVKSYEKYTVDAAMKGSDEDALNALMLHPLCGDFAQAKSCYEEMKAAHKAFLPQFFKGE
jgi:6-phospho-beta-glucosidase